MSTAKCPCGFRSDLPTFSAAWERDHRDHHLSTFPDVDFRTRWNLDMFVRQAEERES